MDILDKMASDIKNSVVEAYAKVAEIHVREANPDVALDEYYTEGYNQAIKDIAAKISQLA